MSLARRLLAILTALVLVTGVFGRVGVAWICEGRVCSSDLAQCCCASPAGGQDGSCGLGTPGRSLGECKARCGCKSVVVKGRSLSAFAPSKLTVAPSALPASPIPEPPAPASPRDALLDSPQLKAIPPPFGLPDPPCIAHAALRAPPAFL